MKGPMQIFITNVTILIFTYLIATRPLCLFVGVCKIMSTSH